MSMLVRITAVDGYTSEVPKDVARFKWLPPVPKSYERVNDPAWADSHLARVYTEIEDLDDLKALVEEFGPYCELNIRHPSFEGQVVDDEDMLEITIYHDCHAC